MQEMLEKQLAGLGPYHLKEILGEGAHATVYRATREGASQDVALKVLHAPLVDDAEALAAFRARAAIAARASHPAVARVIEDGTGHETPYLAMELIPGFALDQLLEHGRPSEKAAVAIVHGILEVLSALVEGHEIVHGRLDPGAVIVQASGRVALCGFGAEAAPEADLPALVTIVQRLRRRWPTEVDAWLDCIQGDAVEASTIQAAADAYPIPLEPGHTKALVRFVKRATAPKPEPVAPEEAQLASDQAKSTPSVEAPLRRQPAAIRAEYASTISQARWVALTCGAFLVLAFALEIF